MPHTHQASCHCGRVRLEARVDIDHVIDCNCSICRRRGALWHGVPGSGLRILSGEGELTLYQFNTMTAKHYFCRHCGIHPFVRPRINPAFWAINVRCIDGFDLESVPVRKFDGEHWEDAARAFYLAKARAEKTTPA